MARISREERLSNLKCELSSGKVVSLYDLRGFSRVVIVAGDATYCADAIEAAEKERDALVVGGGACTSYELNTSDPPLERSSPLFKHNACTGKNMQIK